MDNKQPNYQQKPKLLYQKINPVSQQRLFLLQVQRVGRFLHPHHQRDQGPA